MANSSTEIANLALSHLAIGKEIGNLDTESSEEANACRRFYTTARDMVLSEFAWPFATKYQELALVEENPNEEWAYSYRYPSDCLMIRRIVSGLRMDNRNSRIPYSLAQDDDGTLVYTDQSEPTIVFTSTGIPIVRYPANFVMALSYKLAMLIAPRVTAGDPYRLADRVTQLYIAELRNAQAVAANEEQPDMIPESEFVLAREGLNFDPFATRFDPE